MRIVIVAVLCVLSGCAISQHKTSEKNMNAINLAGQWQVALDPDDSGQQRALSSAPLEQTIELPGSVAQRGYGYNPSPDANWTGDILDRSWFTDPQYAKYRQPGNVKMPFWLTPKKWYVGPAWYRRTIEIPQGWNSDHVTLFLERTHWTTTVWIDGRQLGSQNSLSTPHEYDLGVLPPGKHELAIRVDNRMAINVGINASSVTDHTQTNWNGIIGKIELRRGAAPAAGSVGTPRLHDLRIVGTQFFIDGRPAFLRGTLNCCIYPLTGYPPMDVAAWKRELQVVKDHGLNHVRFHSWCPPEAAFAAADDLGIYFQVEVCTWPNPNVVLGPGSPAGLGDGSPVDQWVYDETRRILRAYGHHPSFIMLAVGNEPGGPNQKAYLSKWVETFRKEDPRRLYTGTSGWPELPENQYTVISDPRIQHWGEGLASRINAKPPETRSDYRDFIASKDKPVISHEIGQWCVYPDLKNIGKYKGLLQARNFEIFRDSLAEHHMLNQAESFLQASGKLQAIVYKEEIESALRTPGMGGFQLLGLQDFPGQGTALVGVVDPFWDSKGYISAEEYRRFAGETVPLARMSKRTWYTDESFSADVEIAHFGNVPIENARPVWALTRADGAPMARGEFDLKTIPLGHVPLGTITVPLSRVDSPRKLVLTVSLDGTKIINSWEIWAYPRTADVSVPSNILVASSLDDRARQTLQSGGKVLLIPAPGTVKGDARGKVEIGFSPIFWNTAWTTRQPPHTLGILCDPKHPALSEFPTEFHSNWQWWELIHDSQAMILDGLPPDARPIVQVIDDWVTNRRLGLLLEAKVGNGKLLVCSMNIGTDFDSRPAAKQMLASLLRYMAGNTFNPKIGLTVEQIDGMVGK
jgi:hypothetical protein